MQSERQASRTGRRWKTSAMSSCWTCEGGGRHWHIEPRLGYTSCRLRDVESGRVEFVGTMKQVLRYLSRQTAHMLGPRNLQ